VQTKDLRDWGFCLGGGGEGGGGGRGGVGGLGSCCEEVGGRGVFGGGGGGRPPPVDSAGQGNRSLRKAGTFAVQTTTMGHHFTNAPGTYS